MAPTMNRTVKGLSVLAALDRHLKQNDSKISMAMAKDRDFVKCRQVLERKARGFREKGQEKQPE